MPYTNLTGIIPDPIFSVIMADLNNARTALLPYLVNLTPDDIKDMYKMGDKRLSLANEAITLSENNPTLVPNYVNLPAAQEDFHAAQQQAQIEALLVPLVLSVKHTKMARGSEVLTNYVKAFKKNVDGAAEQNVPGAAGVKAMLDVHYDLPDQPDGGEADPAPGPGVPAS
jgi:hypothetical protein